jgi:hypothetical protein
MWWRLKLKKYLLVGKIALKYIYYRFLQHVYPTPRIEGGRYKVNYVLNDRVYTMLIKKKRGPPRLLCATNEEGDNVTETVMGYLGPNEDFHGGAALRPSDMGLGVMTVLLRNGKETRIEAETIWDWKKLENTEE